ncbi:hypothetical protein ROS9278_03904 [Roseomonas sp. CECT 9278]|nr:hypothetical protein ROS9278_03904 [Roseomonas sp. CECT 9278]
MVKRYEPTDRPWLAMRDLLPGKPGDRGARTVHTVTSVNVVENADGLEVATAQAALGGSCRVSLAGGGLSMSPMASTPM